MKNILLKSMVLSGLFVINNAKAESFWGATHLHDQTFDQKVSVTGALHACNTSFKSHLHVNGSTNLHDVYAKDIDINGALDMYKTHLASGQVNGSAHLHEAVIDGSLKVNGSAYFTTVTVPVLTITGGLRAKHSTINTMTITAKDIILDESSVKNDIVIKASNSNSSWSWWCLSWTQNKGTPEIKLHASIVDGAIIFSGAAGVVHLYGDKNKIHRVENGKIIMHNESEFSR